MSVPLYLDHMVSPRVARELRLRGVDVTTAFEDGNAYLRDEPLLERATQLGRVLYTEDDDFFAITARWLATSRDFSGLACAPQRRMSIGETVKQLELIAKAYDPEDVVNLVIHLPW